MNMVFQMAVMDDAEMVKAKQELKEKKNLSKKEYCK